MTTLGRVADGTIVGRLDGSSVFELSYIGLALDKTMLGGRAAGSVIAFPGINPANGFTDIGFARIAAFKMFGDGSNELILQLDLATGRLSAT